MWLYGSWNNEHKNCRAIFVLVNKVKKKNLKWQMFKKKYVSNKDWKVVTKHSSVRVVGSCMIFTLQIFFKNHYCKKKSLLLHGILNLGGGEKHSDLVIILQFIKNHLQCPQNSTTVFKPNPFPQSIPATILPMLADIMQDKSNIELLSMIQETWGRRGGRRRRNSQRHLNR